MDSKKNKHIEFSQNRKLNENTEEEQQQNLEPIPDQVVRNAGNSLNDTFTTWEYMLRESKAKEEEISNCLDNMVERVYCWEKSCLEQRLTDLNRLMQQK